MLIDPGNLFLNQQAQRDTKSRK